MVESERECVCEREEYKDCSSVISSLRFLVTLSARTSSCHLHHFASPATKYDAQQDVCLMYISLISHTVYFWHRRKDERLLVKYMYQPG